MVEQSYKKWQLRISDLWTFPVYILRKRALGDVLWIEPVISSMAARHKRVVVQTYHNDLFYNYPYSNVTFKHKLSFFERIGRNLRLPNFINLDESYEKTPHMHILHAYQQKAHLPVKEEYPKLYLNEAERKSFIGTRYMVLHLEGSSEKNYRRIYGINWAEVIALIKRAGYEVLYIGKQDDEADAAGATYIRTSLREMIALLYNATFFIGIDSGPSHIAASLSVPSLLFFGAVTFEYRHFRHLFNGYVLQNECEFAGCYHNVPDHHKVADLVCRIAGDEGTPPCSLHNTAIVQKLVQQLIAANRKYTAPSAGA